MNLMTKQIVVLRAVTRSWLCTRVLVAVLANVACTSEPNDSSWTKPESTTLGCGDYLAIPAPPGILYNNVWNKHAAQLGEWSQCLEKRTHNRIEQFGWSWRWPTGKQLIYAYPQIKLGASPWAPEPRVDERFPAQIGLLQTFELSYDVESSTNGEHNLAASMWLTKEPVTGSTPNPAVITTEIMIWTFSTKEHFNPAGKKIQEILIDGITWELWVEQDWKDASGINDNRWSYVTFRSTKHFSTGRIDILKLLQHAIEQKLITPDLYVADIELGNEIMSGSGITWIKSFNVMIR